jgi:hypothetical protein
MVEGISTQQNRSAINSPMNTIRTIILLVAINAIVSCSAKNNPIKENESCKMILKTFGEPNTTSYKILEGKNTQLNVIFCFEGRKYNEEQIKSIASEYQSVNPDESPDLPKLWLNTSSWNNLTNESKHSKYIIESILKDGFNNKIFLFKAHDRMNERLVISRQGSDRLIILFEASY